MTKPQRQRLKALIGEILTPPDRRPVHAWAAEHLSVPPPTGPGRISWAGYEYLMEPLDAFNAPGVREITLCFGSQSGKTTLVMAGVGWSVCEDPSTIIWAMPNDALARSFSITRFVPMVEATALLRARIPGGRARRTRYKTMEMALGASQLTFVGSNSPANTTSRPARKIVMDEVDKLGDATAREARAVEQLEARTKAQPMPLIVKTSTPTDSSGPVWEAYLAGDRRRYHVPCPACGKMILLVWSKQFTVLPTPPETAFVTWDKAARRDGGGWDLDRVAASTRVECPHCHSMIDDSAKTRMVRSGVWVPGGPVGAHRSYHLPSLYATGPNTAWGRLAVRFLQAKGSIDGLRGFITNELAEPFEGQDRQQERVEIITESARQASGDAGRRLMTVDCQASSPHFWWVVRQWEKSAALTVAAGIECGHCETWEDLRAIQLRLSVEDVGVVVDSGFGARSDAEVYRQCARFAAGVEQGQGRRPLMLGWMPSKGMASRKRWRDSTGLWLPYYLRTIDPFGGTADAGVVEMSLFEFSGDYFKDVLCEMRDPKRSAETGVTWSVPADMATEEYWRHMDAEVKTAAKSKKTGKTVWEWRPRGARWPNHLLDCEVQQVAAALFYGLLAVAEQKEDHVKSQ